MKEADLIIWIKQQAPVLDKIIARAGRAFQQDELKKRLKDQFAFDLAECQIESWNLVYGKDLCYDRPNTPFVYSLWYHGRRVNTFLTHFASTLLRMQDIPSLEIFDLGAGTGAVQWAVGLVYHKMKEEGLKVPKIKIINVDTSPFMLDYGKNYLWNFFLEEYKHCCDFSADIEYEINSWNNDRKLRIVNPWVTASYLFDISDSNEKKDYKKAVLENFQSLVEKYKPSIFLLLTSVAKEGLADEVANEFSGADYLISKIKHKSLILQGQQDNINIFRQELFATYNDFLRTKEEISLRNPSSWHDASFVGTIISKRQLEIYSASISDEGFQLHNKSIRKRKEVELNEDQKKAARNVNQPAVIIGPAGCGKSIVITERLLNIVQDFEYSPNIRILLTTFNTKLLDQLQQWVMDLLDEEKIARVKKTQEGAKIFFIGNESEIENIRILNFDLLPRDLGGIRGWGLVDKNTHKRILFDIIQRVKTQNNIKDAQFDRILNPDFLLEEYHRVIYGLQVPILDSKEDYLAVYRRGRGISLDKARRELVWQCLQQYEDYIYSKHIPSFFIRRQLFLNKLRGDQIQNKFDYVIVDEFQDCTKADFEIFFSLLKSPNSLIISGDLAQSVQLGRSANIDALREAIRADRKMNDISWHYLDGSYRLPFRICEAITKISEHIHLSFKRNPAVRILAPYKGAPPGARPIVVIGDNQETIAIKIRNIIEQYKRFDLREKCILENDENLSNFIDIESDSVLKLKGLEKNCVIWSTRVPVTFEKEKFEFIYTILTRTCSILIIALFDNDNSQFRTQGVFMEAIGMLNTERLIFWDKETKTKFSDFCSVISGVDEEEE